MSGAVRPVFTTGPPPGGEKSMGRERAGLNSAKSLFGAERAYAGIERGPGELRVALAFPNSYGVGISNLGFQTMLARARMGGSFAADRVFLPDEPVKILRTFEEGAPVGGTDVFAFSVSFENDSIHLLHMLRAARIPLHRKDRGDSHPLIVVGGAITYLNPEPLRDFVDIFLLGDGEELFVEYLDLRLHDFGLTREAHISRAAGLDGAYVPAVHDGPAGLTRRSYAGFERDPAVSRILTPNGGFKNTLLIEISRGCPRRCRYCSMPVFSRRFRTVPTDVVLDTAERFREEDRKLGRDEVRKVGLVSAAFFDHPDAGEMVRELTSRGFEVAVSSLRVERMTDPVLSLLRKGGLRSLTVAPETATDRMRNVIGRAPDEEAVLGGVERAARAGFRSLRLYYMIGLPTETEEDRTAIVRLTKEIRSCFLTAGSGEGRITVSLHPFVPKPMTPFQWSRMLKPDEIRDALRSLRGKLRGFHVKSPSLKDVYIEGILARGGVETGSFIERLADGRPWRRAAAESGIDLDKNLYTDRGPDADFPWEEGRASDGARSRAGEWERAIRYGREDR